MAEIIEIDCQRCGTVTSELDGPTMMGFNPRCLRCGVSEFVSLTELLDTDPPGFDSDGDQAWSLRRSRIPEVSGICDECGGTFSEDAPIRCGHCRSRDVTTRAIGSAC
jgi:DNA-directed RNA polymerase subunit RPC12/RpoP